MLADKFNRYKLMLMISVTSAVLFHTLLLRVDARVLPAVLPLRNVTEIPTEFICSRTGVILHLGNESCPTTIAGKWLASMTPADCQPLDCSQQQFTRMSLCLSSGNCTQITNKSTSKLELELVLEAAVLDDENGVHSCSAQVATLQTEQTPFPSTMLCNCRIQCPLTLVSIPEPFDEELNNATSIQFMESERLKHNRGFWIYFFLRILASGSLATSFSM